jgi:hypothetical protein
MLGHQTSLPNEEFSKTFEYLSVKLIITIDLDPVVAVIEVVSHLLKAENLGEICLSCVFKKALLSPLEI